VNESLRKDFSTIASSLNIFTQDEITRQKWFVSFGSLLYLIRDFKHGVPFETDMDISITGRHRYERTRKNLENGGWNRIREIRNDFTDDILYAEYESPNGLSLDLFFWFQVGDLLWHTYDYLMEKPSDGRPSKYHFKGTPKWMFEGGIKDFNWLDGEPKLKVPIKYGTLLDYWYPDWFIPNPDFGVSLGIIKEVDSCADLEKKLWV